MTQTSPQSDVDRLYLLYHELRPEDSRYAYAMSSGRFAEQLALFARLRRDPGLPLLPEITFDDGHRSDIHIALPLLAEHGLRAAFFITAGWTNRRADYMTGNDLRDLHRQGHTVGAHGWSHTLLTQCSSARLRSELADSRNFLENELGATVDTMSLPGGRANRRVFAAASELGYRQVFTSAPRPEPSPSAPVLGRLNLRGDATLPWISDLLAPDRRLLDRLRREDRLKQAAKHLLGDSLYAKLWNVVNRAEAASLEAGAESP